MAAHCFHCGEAIPAGTALTALQAGAPRAVCCIGCRAAVEWIEGLGLADYYRLRSEPAARAEAPADFSAWDRPALERLYVRHEDDLAEACVLVEGLRCAPPKGAFYLFVNVAGLIGRRTPAGTMLETDLDVMEYFLDAPGVAVMDGTSYGMSPYLRLSFATSLADIEDGCRRIADACAVLARGDDR